MMTEMSACHELELDTPRSLRGTSPLLYPEQHLDTAELLGGRVEPTCE